MFISTFINCKGKYGEEERYSAVAENGPDQNGHKIVFENGTFRTALSEIV